MVAEGGERRGARGEKGWHLVVRLSTSKIRNSKQVVAQSLSLSLSLSLSYVCTDTYMCTHAHVSTRRVQRDILLGDRADQDWRARAVARE